MKKLAEIFSYAMHPLFLPLYGLFFIFNSNSVFAFIPAVAKNYCYVVTFVCLCLLPVLTLPLFKKLRLIQSYHLSDRKERIYPVIVSVFLCFSGILSDTAASLHQHRTADVFGVDYCFVRFAIVTLRWKMSMHMTAIGAVCGFLLIIGFRYFGDVRTTFMGLLCLAGLLGTCRLYLKKHNPAQVYAGFVFGLSFVFAILY